MNLPTLAVRRPITTAMILVSVLLVGAIAFFRLPLAFLPTLDAPFMFVQIPYPNSHPSQIEKRSSTPPPLPTAPTSSWSSPGARRSTLFA